ncbi:Conserved oligomeric Golgi complex subunit 7 [Komagataella phaffii CBS 7435]|nr:Conserved oligomeric Golgi complex subunit 7 [Komagataella phaffii CBS 7435]CCA36573.1 Conserved oligomeric Golgi complex subunit 7 [Komagataella phaffii CBS 7435]
MAETNGNEVLSMFFDEEFVPHAYVDAVLVKSLPTNTTSQKVIPRGSLQPNTQLKGPSFLPVKQLQSLQSNISSLLSHVDFYSNELTKDLEQQLDKLRSTATVLSYTSIGDDTSSVTRLEYYLDSLFNSIDTLQEDLVEINEKITNLHLNTDPLDRKIMDELKQYMVIKQRMNAVVKVFQTAQTVATTSLVVDDALDYQTAPTSANTHDRVPQTVTVSVFSSSLSMLQEAILEEMQRDKPKKEINHKLVSKCDSMIQLLPVFKGLYKFYTPYNEFVKFLEAQKERYLYSKDMKYK